MAGTVLDGRTKDIRQLIVHNAACWYIRALSRVDIQPVSGNTHGRGPRIELNTHSPGLEGRIVSREDQSIIDIEFKVATDGNNFQRIPASLINRCRCRPVIERKRVAIRKIFKDPKVAIIRVIELV